ncbi:unnamed protein product [Diamesa serratosioi]
MYNLKPILVDQDIQFPKCMYQLKPINNNLGNSTNTINRNSEMSEVEILEQKQKRILVQLEDLKNTLMAMRGDMNLCNKPQQPSQQKSSSSVQKTSSSANVKKLPIDQSYLQDVVINANPQCVPYSVLALKNLWNGRLNLQAEVFTHSSVAEITSEAKDFTAKITKSSVSSNLPTLKVIIIWKDVDTIQMVPSKFSPIYGEVNIIRYLNRIGPNEFFYDIDNHQANLADTTLDICYQLSMKLPVKERQYNLQLLSQRLGKSKFFNDSNGLAIVDIAVSSIVKKLCSSNMKEVPAALTSWLTQVASFTGY